MNTKFNSTEEILDYTIACLRRELWKERINCMFGKSALHDKEFAFLLEALAPAA